MVPTLSELREQEIALAEKKQALDEREAQLNTLAVELSQVPVRTAAVAQREEDCRRREAALIPTEQALRDRRKDVEQREREVASREAAATAKEQANSSTAEQQKAKELSLNQRETVLTSKQTAHDVAVAAHVAAVASFTSSKEASESSAQEKAEKYKTFVASEDQRLAARSQELVKITQAQAEETDRQQRVQAKLDEVTKEVNTRYDACTALEQTLLAQKTAQDEKDAKLSDREAACQLTETKQAAWKDALELRELRVRKEEQDLKNREEKARLQTELSAAGNG